MAPSTQPVLLVVDDNEAVGRLMAEILGSAGYEILLATCAEDAIRICDERLDPVDLVISDVLMPGISGVQLCEILAREKRARRFLLMSALSPELWERRLPILPKPFTMGELLNAVREVLSQPISREART
ncbi:MAG TPA: response regulator [Bryobacteraceae bacterium]|nr:response regulator [Bryobacteraceae bacterium]